MRDLRVDRYKKFKNGSPKHLFELPNKLVPISCAVLVLFKFKLGRIKQIVEIYIKFDVKESRLFVSNELSYLAEV